MIHFSCKNPECKQLLMDWFSPPTLEGMLDAVGFGEITCSKCGTKNYVNHRMFSGDRTAYTQTEFRALVSSKLVDMQIGEIRRMLPDAGLYEIGVDRLPDTVIDPRKRGPIFPRMFAVVLSENDVRYVCWDESGQLYTAPQQAEPESPPKRKRKQREDQTIAEIRKAGEAKA